ncbi:hypothetical protein RGR602_CH00618 [Rhizobium gallicum bv. gallicum R602sp]|uniref:Uncharacterized protein n=1 Tax=Rhizobium gallicum bv. gallicum R602sp TaxID=1041138 RepID=A0A0B4X0B6_9HYPH|nr:hypothetical protein RGR602_CH00618 [Rhizobium gallicum bv. gallicum R602sp]
MHSQAIAVPFYFESPLPPFRRSGAVDLNRSGSTINPSGVNPAIPSSPACTNAAGQQDDAATGTSGLGCPPLPR